MFYSAYIRWHSKRKIILKFEYIYIRSVRNTPGHGTSEMSYYVVHNVVHKCINAQGHYTIHKGQILKQTNLRILKVNLL